MRTLPPILNSIIMKQRNYLIAVLALLMSTADVTNVWADGDDPIPFKIQLYLESL